MPQVIYETAYVFYHAYRGPKCIYKTFIDRVRRRKMNLVLLQRDNKRLPIDEQSDECIDYVYSLIPSISME